MVTTDYTQPADTMLPGAMQTYRLMHWLRDIIRNFLADEANITDDRLKPLAGQIMYKVALPYTAKDAAAASQTPAILVSLESTSYPVRSVTLAGTGPVNGAQMARFKGMRQRIVGARIAIVTESCDGTLLLSNLIEDFLVINELNLVQDCGMLSEFTVKGSSGPQELAPDSAHNAKPLYQAVISVSMSGGISWISDTQGPLFKGITPKVNIR